MTDAIMEALMAVAVGVVFIMTLGFAIVKAADAWLWLEGLIIRYHYRNKWPKIGGVQMAIIC